MLTSMFGGPVWDLLIVGAGPAGLSAAVNAKARNLNAVIVENREPISKVRTYPEVTNYLGFPRVSGSELANHFAQHFAKTGYEFKKELVLKIDAQGDVLMTSTNKGVHQSKAVVLSVGVAQTKVLPGEEQFLGRGVSYCVTCDGALFRGKDIVVVGYIPEGEEEANALAGLARSLKYVATYAPVGALEEPVELIEARPISVEGDARMRALKTDIGDLQADGLFIIREAVPAGTLVDGLEVTNNFVHVDRDMATNIDGVFAAGDCTGPPFQIAKAAGEGQIAALSAARYVHGSRTSVESGAGAG